MTNENPCPFCVMDRKAITERLIVETRNFMVIPTYGQIVEGYVLIVPKRHAKCIGDLSEEEMAEYEALHKRVRFAIRSAYGQKPIAFEHGVAGQTVQHAHMHLAPNPPGVGMVGAITEDFPDHHYSDYSLTSLRAYYHSWGKYLYFENTVETGFVFRVTDEPPPQYLRMLFAREAGVPERGNWRDMSAELDNELIASTRRNLKAVLT